MNDDRKQKLQNQFRRLFLENLSDVNSRTEKSNNDPMTLAFYEDERIPSIRMPRDYDTQIALVPMGSIETAYHLRTEVDPHGKTGVLCFASASNAGGGVQRGIYAQEESICVETSAFPPITTLKAYGEFYLKNKESRKAKFRKYVFQNRKTGKKKDVDGIIYDQRLMYVGNAFITQLVSRNGDVYEVRQVDPGAKIDLAFMAFPRFKQKVPLDTYNEDVYMAYIARIRMVMDAFYANGCSSVVLGAWGCGAFHNSPTLVAEAFKEVMLSEQKKRRFQFIYFGIPKGKDENYKIFKKILYDVMTTDNA